MIYFKSVIAGFVATIIAEVLVVFGGISALLVIASRQPRDSEGGFGWDPVSFARTPAGWIIFFFAFVVGLWWEYGRLVAR